MKKLILLISFFILSIVALLGAVIFYTYNVWTYQGKEQFFTISSGETFGKVNQRLEDANIILSTRAFHYLARYKGKVSSLNHGKFIIKQGMNLEEILGTLCGASIYPMVVIPEGKNLYEVAHILENANIVKAKNFIQAAKDKTLIHKTFATKANSVEGYLFPNTYQFAPDTPAQQIVSHMVAQFHKATEGIDFQHPLLTKEQVIILASIVEKETGAQFERKTIAGVFLNRLKKHMRLQSDPTTIYGIWERFKGNLKKSDLLEKTAYNTYAIDALPIGPIANPSLDAIRAILEPEQHEYYYFVSRNDGTHVFSKTYAEHDAAVTNFQRTRANREGKSWRQLKQKK